jgi:hypothetical protein
MIPEKNLAIAILSVAIVSFYFAPVRAFSTAFEITLLPQTAPESIPRQGSLFQKRPPFVFIMRRLYPMR